MSKFWWKCKKNNNNTEELDDALNVLYNNKKIKNGKNDNRAFLYIIILLKLKEK